MGQTLYVITMLSVSGLLLILGFVIFKGNIGLIHDYHYGNVKDEDKPAYTKASGLHLMFFGLVFACLGVLQLLGFTADELHLGVAFTGIAVWFVVFIHTQRKYNGGVFG